jgi:hypothetical protein
MKIKLSLLAPVILMLIACSEDQVGNFVFEKSLQASLIQECKEKNKDPKKCITQVKSQIKGCMKKSGNFTDFQKSKDPKKTMNFVTKFYPCFKDAEGKPLFGPKKPS